MVVLTGLGQVAGDGKAMVGCGDGRRGFLWWCADWVGTGCGCKARPWWVVVKGEESAYWVGAVVPRLTKDVLPVKSSKT